MNQLEAKGGVKAMLSLLGKAKLPQESLYPFKIPNSDVWVVLVKKDLFYPAVVKELNLVVKEHRWELGEKVKEGYWDIQ